MSRKKADVLFHPVRIRIVQALFGGRKLTAQQLLAEIGEASIATLYRQLGTLVKAEVLVVAEERPIRGAVEKTYMLAHDRAADISANDLRRMTRDEHVRHFGTFLSSLLADYERYVGQPRFDVEQDGVHVRQEVVELTDAECRKLPQLLQQAISCNAAKRKRAARRRLLTLVVLPVVETRQPGKRRHAEQ